ncbi:MAG: ABC-F family ATP-binding cassette domain-containing protein [Bacteroidales bacterium]
MFSINNLSVQFNGDYLFEEVSFIINKRDRIGLVGKNGAGKTTMMRIITRQMEPESGLVVIPSAATVGYLPQEMKLHSTKTVLDETFMAFSEANQLEERIEKYTREIAEREDYESESYHKLAEKLAFANERFALIGGATQQARAEKVLLGLGFEHKDFQRSMSEFSGGWQMRVELAKILLQNPDLLLLDEPTNHLDIESIQWLEGFLQDYSGAVVLISHDRAFLDNITKRTVEISNGKIYDYKANYSDYEVLREERLEQEMAQFTNQQKEIAQIERFITRFRAKATKAKQVQSRVKLLEKMDRVEVDNIDLSGIHFRFNQAPPSGKIVIEAENIGKKYGEKTVLENLEFSVSRGEKLAFVGRNGEGKTTLSRIITGELDHTGSMKLGHNVVMGYYAQNQTEMLDGEKTVFQTLDDVAVGDIRPKIRNILGGFLFQGEDIDKKVKVLSGGEKSRLAIARILLSPVNLLVLDEPTNHLDMRSKDILKSALLQFEGTIILVSHDRDFLQGLSTRVFEFKNRKIKEFLGDIYDFIENRNIQHLSDLEQARKTSFSGQTNSTSDNKLQWERKKEQEKEMRKIQNQITRCEDHIAILEEEIRKAEAIISNPTQHPADFNNDEFFKNYSALKEELQIRESEWEEWQLKLEEMG